MSEYVSVPGDSFALIARKYYGRDDYAYRIQISNPVVTEPIAPGTVLNVPVDPNVSATQTAIDRVQTSGGEVAVFVDDRLFTNFTELTLDDGIDRAMTLECSIPYEPSSIDDLEAFRPFSYKPVALYLNRRRVFSGTLVNVRPEVKPNSAVMRISCYARCGVLEDCCAPFSMFPLQFAGSTLDDIATSLCEPFALSPQFDGDVGAAFDKNDPTAMKRNTTVLNFLQPLAQQRNFVIGSDSFGNPFFRRSIDKDVEPVYNLREGQEPLVSVTPQFNGRSLFTDVGVAETVTTRVSFGNSGPTEKSEKVVPQGFSTIPRWFNYESNESNGGEIETIFNSKVGRMFAGAISYDITVAGWMVPGTNDTWSPNTHVTVLAASAMILNRYKFLVRSVSLDRTASEETATLTVTLPGVFAGNRPKKFPWELS